MTDKTKDLTREPARHTEDRFHNEADARAYLEAVRWPKGLVCPHCGGADRQSRIEANPAKKVRAGLLACGHCRSQYTVTVGTVFEDSKIPLHKWVYANHLICSSKKSISSKQLERVLGVTYKTAWFMSHRLRASMDGTPTGQLGGGGKVVEVDETYYGRKQGRQKRRAFHHKNAIVSLVERGGKVRSFHVPSVTGDNLRPTLRAHISYLSEIHTDELSVYAKLNRDFAAHETVNHNRDEYVRGTVTTNTVEGFFSILKRGLTGIYQCVSEQHLQRYVDEFDFRYNHRQALGYSDDQRAVAVLKQLHGKRLTYKRVNATTH
ncbi:MAG TPA: IS1595 family transposase [Burkholderiales bacterium]|nr:IS1595 family transposase [Burkholderiales bacterium]